MNNRRSKLTKHVPKKIMHLQTRWFNILLIRNQEETFGKLIKLFSGTKV